MQQIPAVPIPFFVCKVKSDRHDIVQQMTILSVLKMNQDELYEAVQRCLVPHLQKQNVSSQDRLELLAMLTQIGVDVEKARRTLPHVVLRCVVHQTTTLLGAVHLSAQNDAEQPYDDNEWWVVLHRTIDRLCMLQEWFVKHLFVVDSADKLFVRHMVFDLVLEYLVEHRVFETLEKYMLRAAKTMMMQAWTDRRRLQSAVSEDDVVRKAINRMVDLLCSTVAVVHPPASLYNREQQQQQPEELFAQALLKPICKALALTTTHITRSWYATTSTSTTSTTTATRQADYVNHVAVVREYVCEGVAKMLVRPGPNIKMVSVHADYMANMYRIFDRLVYYNTEPRVFLISHVRTAATNMLSLSRMCSHNAMLQTCVSRYHDMDTVLEMMAGADANYIKTVYHIFVTDNALVDIRQALEDAVATFMQQPCEEQQQTDVMLNLAARAHAAYDTYRIIANLCQHQFEQLVVDAVRHVLYHQQQQQQDGATVEDAVAAYAHEYLRSAQNNVVQSWTLHGLAVLAASCIHQDVLLTKMQLHMAQRLLSMWYSGPLAVLALEHERMWLSHLEQLCLRTSGNAARLHAMRTMLHDYCTSRDAERVDTKLSVLVVNRMQWPAFVRSATPSVSPLLRVPCAVQSQMDAYRAWYCRTFTNRVLQWAPHLSQVVLVDTRHPLRQRLHMTALQACICLSLSRTNNVDDIWEAVGGRDAVCSSDQLLAALTALHKARLVVLSANTKTVELLNADGKDLRADRRIGAGKMVVSKTPQQKQHAQHDVKYMVQAAIVSVMKHSKTSTYSDLFDMVCSKLGTHFSFTKEVVKQNVEDLLLKDYLRRDDDDHTLLHYVV